MENSELEKTIKIENDIFEDEITPTMAEVAVAEVTTNPVEVPIEALADEVVEVTPVEAPKSVLEETIYQMEEQVEPTKTNWTRIILILLGIGVGLAIIAACFTFLFNY